MNSLNVKIAALEKTLAEKDRALRSETNASPEVTEGPASQPTANDGVLSPTEHRPDAVKVPIARFGAVDAPQPSASASKDQGLLDRLLSVGAQYIGDPSSGRPKFFGTTANCHVFLTSGSDSDSVQRLALEQNRRAQRVIGTLSQATHDYLLQLFWDHHNSVIPVVHREAFEEGRRNGGGLFYSGVLHVCLLAVGFRYAERNRPDISKISISQHESMLHMEAKFMVDSESEQPVTLSSIASLLLLGDLEYHAGRDNVGWRYAGMANRSCCEIGLHLGMRNSGACPREIELGRMILGACIMYDRYWALVLGRPSSLKVDVTLSHLPDGANSTEQPRINGAQAGGLEAQTHKSHMDLMEIASKITEIADQSWKFDSEDSPSYLYASMANLNRELDDWYTQLPRPLKLTKDNVQTSPPSLFLLDQQYHANMILLHLPFAKLRADKTVPKPCADLLLGEPAVQPGAQFSSVSRAICRKHALCVIQTVQQQRQRFKTGKVFGFGLHHLGTAAIALLVVIGLSDASLHANADNMRHLESVIALIEDLSRTYQLAERMSTVLKTAVTELRARLPLHREDGGYVPARCDSMTVNGTEQQRPNKRRRTSNCPQYTPSPRSKTDQNAVVGRSSPRPRPQNMTETYHQTSRPPSSILPGSGFTMSQNETARPMDHMSPLSTSSRYTIGQGRTPNRVGEASGPSSPQNPPLFRDSRLPPSSPEGGRPDTTLPPNTTAAGEAVAASSGPPSQVIDRLHDQSIFPNLNGLEFLSILCSDKNV